MVNFGLNSASILGIFLAVAGASLYFLRSVRPELSRDHDIFFAAVGLLCGLILLFQGWRLDPILQFGQFLLTGSAIFFAVETIRLRGVATEQARRNTPIVDPERPVSSRVRVQAELDQIEPYEEEDYDYRRLRGYPEPRSTRRSARYEEEPRTPSRSSTERPSTSSRKTPSNARKRRPRPSSAAPERYDTWEQPDNSETAYPRLRPEPSLEAPPKQTRRRRPRPADSADTEIVSTDYVDYQPVDDPEASRDREESERRPNRPERPRDDFSSRFDY